MIFMTSNHLMIAKPKFFGEKFNKNIIFDKKNNFDKWLEIEIIFDE